ncbi:hypothetical protein PSEUDO8O_50283 [Pseudomonas sp. 8O]|nr:hypothetical protein PSEUDO8O_50283 [Pseudomonas sp. 8O]
MTRSRVKRRESIEALYGALFGSDAC